MPHNFRVDMTLPTHPHFFGDSGGRWGGGGVPIARPAGFGDNGGRWGTRGGIPTQFPAGFGDSGAMAYGGRPPFRLRAAAMGHLGYL